MIKDQRILVIDIVKCKPIYQFSTCFKSIAENLGINNKSTISSNDEINAIIKKLENHPSIRKMKESSKSDHIFSFSFDEKSDFLKEIDVLDCSKAHQEMKFLLKRKP